MTTIAITGAGGFIGKAMAERALALGWRVQGLDCNADALAPLTALGVITVIGSVNDASAVAQAVRGADWVFHTAAIVEEDGDPARYQTVNVEGTRTVCQVSRDCGVRGLVQLSSVMVYGFDFAHDVAESGVLAGNGNPYNETKRQSEEVALAFNSPGFWVTALRAGDVYGADSRPWVLRPLALLRQGLFMLPDSGRGVINPVHVQNLLDAALLAASQPHKAAGQAFNVTDGVAVPCKEFFAPHARHAGRRLIALPTGFVGPLVRLAAWAYRVRKQPAPFSPAGLRFLQRRGRYSIAKAQHVLGYTPRIAFADGMAALAAEWQRGV